MIYIYLWLNTKTVRSVNIIEINSIEIKHTVNSLHFLLGNFAIYPMGIWMVFYSNLVFLSYDITSTLIFFNFIIFNSLKKIKNIIILINLFHGNLFCLLIDFAFIKTYQFYSNIFHIFWVSNLKKYLAKYLLKS